MGIFDRFRKTKQKDKKPVIKKEAVIGAVKKTAAKVAPKEEKPVVTKKVTKKEFSEAWRILKEPLITEKTTDVNTASQYVFKVADNVNKTEIKKAVQDMYGVQVLAVNIIKVPGKKRRLGRHEGWHSGYKKAIVFLPPEEKIDVISR